MGFVILFLVVMNVREIAAQITTVSEGVSNAEINAQTTWSNMEAKAKADAEYIRLHPEEATNALTQHQLELLDINVNRMARSNYLSQNHSPEELEEFNNTVRYFLTNAAAQSSYFFHVHGMLEGQYVTNVLLTAMRHKSPPQPWPALSQKQEIFENCASLLHLAIDTNQINLACKKLTNQPNAVIALKALANEAVTNLIIFSDLLFNPDLNSYWGYRAKLTTLTNVFYINFWFSTPSNPDTPIRDIEKRSPDDMNVIVSARFYQNGKLQAMSIGDKGLFFNEDGTLRNYYANGQNIWLP
jgi:hypothetical protein